MTEIEFKILDFCFIVFLVIVKIIIIGGSIRNSMIAHKQIKHLNKCLDDQKEMIDYLLDKKPKPQKSGLLNYSDDVFEIDEKPQPPENRIIKNGKIK